MGESDARFEATTPIFLKRYDCKRVSGWGSANDMPGKDLSDVKEAKDVQEDIRGMHGNESLTWNAGWSLANTGENSTSYLGC